MRYSKFLIMSASIFTVTLSYAACTGSNCFNQGVDFANQAKPSSDSISNSVLESAVGANNIAQAQATQDSIQSTMGNDYKNIDGITNSGKNKAQACVGKDTAECKAYNYYNDPLTKLSQQGIESAVGIASNLINKKIQQNVNLTDYCAQNPNDSICKMCKDDPSQSMCQSGNKCTTISYNTGDSKYVTNGCQIIGQRGYDCSKWVDDVKFHINTETCDPRDSSCNSLRNNKSCIKINNATFNYSCDSSNRKTSNLYCPYWDNVQTGGGGGNFVWGTCNWGATYNLAGIPTTAQCGINQGNPSPSWHVFYDVIIYETYQCTVIDQVIWKDNCSN